jgi:putative oxidoreductase
MIDAALLVLRGVTGGLLAGHGAQKVFGAFEGPGPEGTRGMMRRLRVRPAEVWGPAAGLSELVGGGLTALGALSPVGPLTAMAPMAMATATAHWGRPIWVTKGGAELPVTDMAAFAALAMAGPGRLSVDGALGIRLPRWVVGLTAAGVAAGTVAALALRAPAEPAQPEPGPEPQAEEREAVATAAEESRERDVELRAAGRRPAPRRKPAETQQA